MKPTLFTIVRSGRGELSTMSRPRGGDWLVDEMTALDAMGIDVLVSTLTTAEQAELELLAEPDSARDAGLRFISFPIPDRSVPDAHEYRSLVYELHDALNGGRRVVIHCRMGIGRSSLVAAGVLAAEGLRGNDAWEMVADARGLPVPDTELQRTWLSEVTETW